MIDRVFVYGTLLIPAVLQAVTGKILVSTAATLPGYGRYRLRGRVYPGIVQAAHRSVDGLVYHGVNRHCLALLDAFEGDEYRRIRVLVKASGGKRIPAYTYVIRPRYSRLLMKQDWGLEEFVKKDLKLYLQRLTFRV